MACGLQAWLRIIRTGQRLTPEMEANRCAISARDCNDAKKYLDAYLVLKQKDDDSGTNEFSVHREGLLIAAIVSYSRAFTESRSTQFAVSKAKVNLGNIFGNDTSRIKLHKFILNKRHKAVAHSDWEHRNTKLLEATKNILSSRGYSVVGYSHGIDIAIFRSMAETMRDHFRHKAFDLDVASATS